MTLETKGPKEELIERLPMFLKDDSLLETPVIPAISKAKKNTTYPLHKNTSILKGSYKNDLKTRIFMKTASGRSFSFYSLWDRLD